MKKIVTLDFKNSLQSKITIYICGHQDEDKMHIRDTMYVYYSDKNIEQQVHQDSFEEFLMIPHLLSEERILKYLVEKPLAELYNKWWHLNDEQRLKDQDFYIVQGEMSLSWYGQDCQLFGISQKLNHSTTWFYKKDDNDSCYVFEIATMYPFKYHDPEDTPDYVLYDDWKKDHKTIVSITVDEKVVEGWAKQLEELYVQLAPYDNAMHCLDDFCLCRPYECCLYPKEFESINYELSLDTPFVFDPTVYEKLDTALHDCTGKFLEVSTVKKYYLS